MLFLAIVAIPVWIKWLELKGQLPLNAEHRALFFQVYFSSAHRLRRFPNLKNPRTFSDRAQWLKLFSQSQLVRKATDKVLARVVVSEAGFERVLIPVIDVLQSGELMSSDAFESLPDAFVIKSAHDSNSALIIEHKKDTSPELLNQWITLKSRCSYGVDTAEWNYWGIEKRFLIEEHLTGGANPATDYKFHCVDGFVVFTQVISGRGRNTSEFVCDATGQAMELTEHPIFQTDAHCVLPENFLEMVSIAGELSKPFKYVRVDLYSERNRIWFGEFTFFPLASITPGPRQHEIGSLLRFSVTDFQRPVQLGMSPLEWVLGCSRQ